MHALTKSEDAAPRPEQGQYLSFTLGSEVYGVGILGVKEIIGCGHLTVVPMMPAWTRGVINLRGAVVPVIDLACRFGRPMTPIGRRTCIVVVEVATDEGQQVMGILVDAVNTVLDIARQHIEPAPSFGLHIRPDFIAGMTKVGEQFVVLLDVDRVLAIDELAAIPALADLS